MALSLKIKENNGVELLVAEGRLINIDSKKFQRKLEIFCKKKHPHTVIDISDVLFIDSFGLGILVQHHNMLKNENRTLILLNSNPKPDTYVRRLFDMTGLDKIFTVAYSDEELSALMNMNTEEKNGS